MHNSIYFIQKIIHIALCTTVTCILLCGCEAKAVPTLSEADYTVDDATVTSTGIAVGDSLDKFLNIYDEYPLLTSVSGDDYQYLTSEVIPYDQDASIILGTFFIDNASLTIDDICATYEIEKESFLDVLNSESFLSNHSVVYRYMVFSFSNGYITDITSDSRDFNYEFDYDAGQH